MLAAALFALAAPVDSAPQPVQVAIEREGDQFVAEFDFPDRARAWGFFRSSLAAADGASWRGQSWKVLTPGVRLERRGRWDALVASDGGAVPDRVRVRVAPFTGEVQSDYVPALKLGGASVALFDGHFATFSVDGPDRLDTLPTNFDTATVGDFGTRVAFEGDDAFRLAGDVAGYREGRSAGTYGLFGVPTATVTNGVATVIDSELPGWIAGYIADFTPKVIESLQQGLGPSGTAEPTILAAWEGAERDGASMNGGSLKGLVLMRLEGRKALTARPALRDMVRWFIAHETAHFWLGQAVAYETAADSWIMEGGADLLAVRTVAKLDPAFDPNRRLNEALADCVRLAEKPISSAHDRGDFKVHYACGAVFGLVAEQARGGDFLAFNKGLIDANREDGYLSRAEWLAELDRASGKPILSRAIATLLDDGAVDPRTAVSSLLREGGITYRLDSNGVPQLP